MDINSLVHPFLKISDDIAFNPTVFIQLGIFLALYAVLKPLLWKPTLAVLDQRKALTSGRKQQAASGEAEIKRMEAEYQEKIRTARAKANEERGNSRVAAQNAAKEIVDAAKNESAKSIAAVRSEVASAVQKARVELQSEADATAKIMTEKILGRAA